MSDSTQHPMSLRRGVAAQHALLMISLLGSGGVLAQATAATPMPAPSGYPAWSQPAPPANYPTPGQEANTPPPGPYVAPQAGQTGPSAGGFTPPGYGRWPAGPDSGMSREQFLKQQAERHDAMRQPMPGRPPQVAPQGWPDAEQQRQAQEQRMNEMRTRHQQWLQQGNWPQAPQTAADMTPNSPDMQVSRDERWQQLQAREREMNRLWEQMQAQHREMREQFEQMRREFHGQQQATAPAPQGQQPAPQAPTAAPAPYGYPAPYGGYAPRQGFGYPYGPGR